jgi:hypothetical protein
MDFTIFSGLVIAAVPMIVAAIKRFITDKYPWANPILATVLGASLNLLSGLHPANAIIGGILGLAGIGLRELITQFTSKPVADKPTNG